ncbi:Peptidylprolyl isomerase domain and WD repeat-containing protein 1 [Paragonimus heterotremus]|uniref:Peptidylprolyl isomerase domain and WD repeat-containing protein 1 n=1 Tax=Paragonimus heterotremus TaxID=100268 RepID=A0A8J4SSJ2_9TREM|nr:Peptidylprolyl isomerase domain and WD repeat-containing protein 1 [Paragonimus heterotremus]
MSGAEDVVGPLPSESMSPDTAADLSREDTVGPLPSEMQPGEDDETGADPAPSSPPKKKKKSAIHGLSISVDGELACTVGDDKTAKVFDVINFDMINMMKLDFMPCGCCFIYTPKDEVSALAISDQESSKIRIYDARSKSDLLHVLDQLHQAPVTCMAYNPLYDCVLSADSDGMLECWGGSVQNYSFPRGLGWKFKSDTDLFCLIGAKTHAINLTISSNGQTLAVLGADRRVRLFRFYTGKLIRVYDESLEQYSKLQQDFHDILGADEGGARSSAQIVPL